MMIIEELTSMNTLLISNALLAGAATIAVLRFQRLTRQLAGFLPHSGSSPGATLTAESEQNALQSQTVEQRILALQKIADELSRKEEMVQRRGARESPYEGAVLLAKSGAGADELTRSCGLNKGEAQLLVRLHASTHH